MNKNEYALIIFSILILTGHAFGIFLHFYDIIPLYDSLLHVIGGLWIASIIFYLIEKRGSFSLSFVSPLFAVCSVSGIVLSFGLLWEFLEYALDTIAFNAYGIMLNIQPSIFDTLKDMGVAWIASMIYTAILVKKK